MALASVSSWQDDWQNNVPNVSDDSWQANLANFVADHVTSLLTSNGLFKAVGQPALTFTFAKATFQSNLGTGTADELVAAFQAAWAASTYVVPVGSFIGTDTPATKFSVVASCIPDAASLVLAAAKIAQVIGIPVASADDGYKSQFPVKLREAFLLITITTTGTNSVAPTPSTLTDTARALQ